MDIGLIDTVPKVVKFLPSGLTFLKPADVAIRFERKATIPDSEHFILHGSYNHTYKKTVWELVTSGIEKNNEEGVINIKITHFSFYTYILTRHREIERFMAHLTGNFTCRAYSFYHRMPSEDTIDISIVLVSKFVFEKKEEPIKQSNDKNKAENEFVNEKKDKDIQQLHDHIEGDYVKGQKGPLKPVDTNRPLELILDFPRINRTPFSFKVDLIQLDSVGFVLDHFKGIIIKKPARGTVEIRYKECNEPLWKLNICEEDLT